MAPAPVAKGAAVFDFVALVDAAAVAAAETPAGVGLGWAAGCCCCWPGDDVAEVWC